MSNEMSNTRNTAMAIPADLASLFGAVAPNITDGEQVPHLSIGGKVFKVVMNGDEKPIMAMVDGEPMPAPTVKVIIINQVPKRSRAYFEGAYVEGSKQAPVCWSIDGESPDSDVAEPQASRCEACPNSVKGSKINDNGDPTTACASSKRIAVVPSNKPDFTALLCKLPVTSLWEGEPKEESQGWYSFDAYLKHLKANGVTHTAMVETTMKFDASVKYPKMLFKFGGFINAEVAAVIAPRVESEEVLHALGLFKGEVETPTESETVIVEAEVPEKKPKEAAKPTKAKKEPKVEKKEEPKVETPVVEDDDDLASVLAAWD